MRLRNIPGADEAIADSPHCIQEPMAEKGRWHLIFGNDHPVHIEIGMGKGQFIMQLAKEHPDINYIGIERYSSVLLRALQKMEIEPLPNIRFLCMDASIITEVFDEEEVAKIYLNFSDPWPKERHAKRRLTHGNFLKLYRQVLKMGGQIHFKTDNAPLFAWSVEEIPQFGFELSEVTRDLHANGQRGVMTDYEAKFYAEGKNINRCVATMQPWEEPEEEDRPEEADETAE